MFFRAAIIAGLVLLAAPSDGGVEASAAAETYQSNADLWVIGPIIRGRNYSHGMPLHPTPRRGGGFQFDFPQAPGSVHAVTFAHGSLAGKRRIVMRYRIETEPGADIRARSDPAYPGMITLYFQRRGDTWTTRGPYETYRWFATFATHTPVLAGTFEMIAPLNGNWTATQVSSAQTAPAAFRDAVANAEQVGFVLGGGNGYGHGAFARGRARMIVTEFRVE